MPKPGNIDIYRDLASLRGGECLSVDYLGSKGILSFRCKNGHLFDSRASNVQQGRWCPVCASKKRSGFRADTYSKLDLIIKEKGGVRVDNRPGEPCDSLLIKCAKGHVWSTKPKSIISGKWCHFCAKNAPLTSAQIQNVAESRGGKCLALELKGSNVKRTWECAHGHRWQASYNSIFSKGSWCPECATGISERICRAYFEQLFGSKFPKRRPDWLRSPEGNQMELDGYSEELKIAFEHHGNQHYHAGSFFVESEIDLDRQKLLDSWKQKLCFKNGVRLFEIPQIGKYVKEDELREFIGNAALDLGVSIPNDFETKNIDLKVAYSTFGSSEVLADLNRLANERGGKCLSLQYVGNNKSLDWECAKGHRWSAAPQSIKSGYWCLRCSIEKRQRSDLDMIRIANSHKGVFLDFVLHKGERLPQFRCKADHVFVATNPKRSWCPMCDRRGTRLTLQELQDMAVIRGGKCLSQSYQNSQTPMLWECSAGHQWTTIPAVIRRGGWCRKCYEERKRLKKPS